MNQDFVELVRALAAMPFLMLGWFFIMMLAFSNWMCVVIAGNIEIEEE